MKSFKQKLLVLLLLLCVAPLFAQEYSKGAILDPVRYSQIEVKPTLVSRNYTSIPRAVSLKDYCPIPENQGPYSTCVGWSTAFAARTISESIALTRTNRTTTSNNVFSPTHVYKNIADNEGKDGAFIGRALEFMKNYGIAKRTDTEKSMYAANNFRGISLSIFANERKYPISGYVTLFANPTGVPGTINERVPPVKKSLAEKMPVVIGMNCTNSFQYAKDIWRPTESPYGRYGGHAMCVIGYDDDKYGGAFEIQNSWGTNWGNAGYIWISYSDFAAFVAEAYAVVENLANYTEDVRFAASIDIVVLNDSRGMPVTYDRQGFYKTHLTYPEGTVFQYQMTNRQAAYVYAFSMDNKSPALERVFPAPGVSPILDYRESTVAWPGEYTGMELSGPADTDYLVVLYSKEELDIGAIERRFANERGSFPERVQKAVGSNFIPFNNVQYNSGKMEFTASTQNQKAVLGLLLAIDRQKR